MLKTFITVSVLTLSMSAMAHQSMAQDPSSSGLQVPSDISESRQRYEKQSRMTYAAPEKPAEATIAEATDAPAETPAKTSPRNRTKGRSGAMRF